MFFQLYLVSESIALQPIGSIAFQTIVINIVDVAKSKSQKASDRGGEWPKFYPANHWQRALEQ
jgi:hypothetical protein